MLRGTYLRKDNPNKYKLVMTDSSDRYMSEYEIIDKINKKKLFIDNLRVNSQNQLEIVERDTYSIKNGVSSIYITPVDLDTNWNNKGKNLKFKINTNLDDMINKAMLLDNNVEIQKIQKHLLRIENNLHRIFVTDANKIYMLDGERFFKESIYESIDLTNIDTSPIVSTKSMFEYTTVKRINLSTFDTSKVKDMSNMFRDCELDSLNLDNFDTSNVEYMNNMFHGIKIKDNMLDLTSFDTHNVKNMSEMFLYAEVQNIDLSSFNTSKVKFMAGMFAHTKTDKIDLSSFDTHNVITTANMFNGAKTKLINIKSFNLSQANEVSGMFLDTFTYELLANDIDISNSTDKRNFLMPQWIRRFEIKSFKSNRPIRFNEYINIDNLQRIHNWNEIKYLFSDLTLY